MNEIICGDCLSVLKTLPDQSVNCCITSPPYWGLRDYGTAKWAGGDEGCNHTVGRFETPCSEKQKSNNGLAGHQAKDICPKCGAKRTDGQLGLEKTPEEYVAKLVEIFREVWRVLRDDGTLWLNLGDSYAGSGKGSNPDGTLHPSTLLGKQGTNTGSVTGHNMPQKAHEIGIKPKDLVGIPWRVAFALQADGWYLRQDIIWHKPNPMPESVTDRCTKSHEYIFLLSKQAKYYYDAEAIKEPSIWADDNRAGQGNIRYGGKRNGEPGTGQDSFVTITETRNRRSVWTVTTKPFREAHFATFPPDLIEPCALAGCPEGGVILDPFMGAGTTAVVAKQNYRNYVGIELNEKYVEMANKRIAAVQLNKRLGFTA